MKVRFSYQRYYISLLLICLSEFSCRGLITIDPPNNSINGLNVYTNDEAAISAVTNIYSRISSDNRNSFLSTATLSNISLYAGLSSDEYTLFNKGNDFLNRFYTNSLSADYNVGTWNSIYRIVFNINSAIEGLSTTKKLTPLIQQQLLGEAKFMRAFCFFFLVNFYGDIPIVLSTDPLLNANIKRSSKDSVYIQIVKDLRSAKDLLSDNFLSSNLISSTSERVRPTKWAALALLSKVYLYYMDFNNAEAQSSELISNTALFKLESLNNVFLKNSSEAIWQLQCISNVGANTGDGNTFILPASGPNNSNYPVFLSSYTVNSFEENDLRRIHWIDSVVTGRGVYYFPYKYKSGALNPDGVTSEYLTVFRLSEQYLIRAEARINQNKISDGLLDLNIVRNRAGLEKLDLSSKDLLLNYIIQERKRELFSEWGNRWMDLKRTGLIDKIMPEITFEKGGTWKSEWQYYPISSTELQADPYLIQNKGY